MSAARRFAKPVFDSLLLVFGVVLGFLVNDWAQGRAQRARTTQALTAIRREIVVNRAAIEEARVHHAGVRDTLAAYAVRHAPVPDRVTGGGMFSPARPVTAAWESARATGVLGDLPYDLVLTLSDVYASQQLYETLNTGIAQSVYADLLRRGRAVVFHEQAANFGMIASEWAQRERNLVVQCDSAIARIDRAQGQHPARPR